MSVSRPNTPSAKKVSFAPHTTPLEPNRPSKSIIAKCEETFSMGLATLHSGITSHTSVKETKTQYVQSLLKFSEKIQALKRLHAPDFIPHTIQFKTKQHLKLIKPPLKEKISRNLLTSLKRYVLSNNLS